ncbi:hypothetical protein KY285_010493 [Solanum tuberosum]|nr:hypothetical protein KY289_011046 [Solanum tuberosum]KAH0734786.1 hypothetical protein KY285_010493 [Solanum tuberosum]
MSVKHGMYFTPMVREFYANYVSLLYHGTRFLFKPEYISTSQMIETRVIRPAMSLSFPCLITSLWRAAAVPILVGIDNQIVVLTKFYKEMMKNESWLEMQVHKTDTEVADWG